jgi:tRNA threonylcarbamoyl adenosine modification protein YeaZ
MELAIDTSTDWAGLALSYEGNTVYELTWRPGQNHTSELFPNLNNLLEASNTKVSSLSAVFVARGPGSYNGLRAGISAAKGLAFSCRVPLVGISTLEIEAYQFAFSSLQICPVHDAGRGEIATALYAPADSWKCLKEEHLTTVAKLCEETLTKTLFCGELTAAAIEAIESALGARAVIPGFCQRLRRPGFLASLGWHKLQAGCSDDLSTLQPIYLRQPPITQRKKKY